MKKSYVLFALLTVTYAGACVGTSKSSNPLSPSIAGPIAGVGITAPTVVAPPVDALVDTRNQPITVKVGNATTNGVRPLTYTFEIATDPGFTNKAFTREGVPQDGSGTTSLTLPQALQAERKYYWHARAEDGANTGPFGATSAFSVFTPVVFGAPKLLDPTGATMTSSQQPELVLRNAARSGPVGTIFYNIDISTSTSFGSLVGSYTVRETPQDTKLTVPVALAGGQYFWRARATDLENRGPFSDIESFLTPATGGGGGGGGGTGDPGEPCGPPYPNTPLGILQCRRSQYPTNMSPADMLAFLKGSTHDFNAAGVSGGPFGILRKRSGNNCGGYSCDIICAGQGSSQKQWDVIGGVEGNPVRWGAPIPDIREDVCEIQ